MDFDTLPDPLELFPPTREAALERLRDFVPRAGREYAARRNEDPGPGPRENVSMLSPYLRHRLLTEREVVEAVLAEHSKSAAGKFIQEVFWRTYWKGWLQMRPQVWRDCLDERDEHRRRADRDADLADGLERARAGETGIDCFDDWARELKATGYLHNHVRMWFASIWIFTLELPWAMGADFFLRHLADGDPASNTLSWRWVAGIQTPGKTYKARRGNIRKYTDGRYDPEGLSDDAEPVYETSRVEPGEIRPTDRVESGTRALLLIHPDDFLGWQAVPDGVELAGALVARGRHPEIESPFGDKAHRWVAAAADDAAKCAAGAIRGDVPVVDALTGEAVAEHAEAVGVETVVTADAPVGPIDVSLDLLERELNGRGIVLRRLRRDWDEAAWPHATRGFFPFRKHIPDLIERAGLT